MPFSGVVRPLDMAESMFCLLMLMRRCRSRPDLLASSGGRS